MSQTTFWLFRPPLITLCAHHVSFFNEGKKNSEALSGAEISLKDKELASLELDLWINSSASFTGLTG